MNNRVIIGGILLILMSVSSCAVFDMVLAEGIGSAERRAAEELTAGYELRMQEALFSTVYVQAFTLGGYAPGIEDYQPGEIVSWRVEAKDGSDIFRYETKRGLLRTEDDGSSWWYLEMTSDGEVLAYAAHMDADLNPRRVRFKGETGRIREFSYDREAPAEYARTAGYFEAYPADAVFSDARQYGDYVTGTQRITVPAGSFDTETSVYTYQDPSSGLDVRYSWWVSAEVPGGLIRFSWENPLADTSVLGEVTRIDRRFTTDLLW